MACRCREIRTKRTDKTILEGLISDLERAKDSLDRTMKNAATLKSLVSNTDDASFYLNSAAVLHSNHDTYAKILPDQISSSITALRSEVSALMVRISSMQSEDTRYHESRRRKR